jgi:hypothetical protein
MNTCNLCTKSFYGIGNNADPLKKKGKCCNKCNAVVCFVRFAMPPEEKLNPSAWIERIRSNDPLLEECYWMFGGYSD